MSPELNCFDNNKNKISTAVETIINNHENGVVKITIPQTDIVVYKCGTVLRIDIKNQF